MTGAQVEIFKNLRAFKAFYNENIKWYKPSIMAAKERFIKHLAQRLKNLKKIEKSQKVIKKNWRELLKENLYKNTTLSLNEKSIIIKILQKERLTEGDKKQLISILSKLPTEELISLLGEDFEKHTQNYVRWGWDYDLGVKKLMLNKYFKIMQREIIHYNRWLTDNIQAYLKRIEGEIRILFEPFIKFKNMGALFGLYKNYIPTNRMYKNYKKIIAKSILDEMRVKFKKIIENWINKYPHLVQLLLLVQSDILKFIDEYETILQPKPTPDYQMFNHHPIFKRDYFEIIDTYAKAYWLGFLFADGWIAIEHKKGGDYYRMGLQLSYNDKDVLERFCESIGLNPKYIKKRLVGSDFSTKLYPISEIRWGDQKISQDLINLGMRYEYSAQKGRRAKTPRLPNLKNRKLMLAFLLGFYDGDGTLGFDKKTGKIRPRIASSDIEFLQQIKRYFGIKYKISSTTIVKFSLRKEKMIKVLSSRLDIDKEIFKEMLSVYNKSLERKRVSLDFFL